MTRYVKYFSLSVVSSALGIASYRSFEIFSCDTGLLSLEKRRVFSRVDCVFNVLENSAFFIGILVPPDFLSLSVLPVLCFVMLKKNLHFSQNSFDSGTTASH